MTQTFGTDSNNDIYIGSNGNLAVLSGVDAVMDACKTATLAQLGEMILSINTGMPNFQSIWVGTPNYAIFESYLRNTILSVLGVTGIDSIRLDVRDNTLFYQAIIITEFGTGEITNGV